jgi:nicotinamidase/pyrazinamidase
MQPIALAKTSLLIVDAQCGFTTLCPQELPVPGGLEIVANVNRLLEISWARIDASQDWHPPDHCSFLGRRDNLYPPHCVMGTPGAAFLPGLHAHRFQTIWRKGFLRDADAYAVTAQHPAFADLLRAAGMTRVVIAGLVTNICCFFTARDLRQRGLEASIVEDASAALDVPAAGLFQHKAKADGERLGIQYVKLDDLLAATGQAERVR